MEKLARHLARSTQKLQSGTEKFQFSLTHACRLLRQPENMVYSPIALKSQHNSSWLGRLTFSVLNKSAANLSDT